MLNNLNFHQCVAGFVFVCGCIFLIRASLKGLLERNHNHNRIVSEIFLGTMFLLGWLSQVTAGTISDISFVSSMIFGALSIILFQKVQKAQ